MKAAPLLISWHNDNSPIYSAHFEPQGKGRFATSGGDNNVRLWKVTSEGEERRVTYLATLAKHTQAVNVVRFAPKGEVLATAGDDGNTLLWVPTETQNNTPAYGEEGLEDKERWRTKHMCRSLGSEIYDLAWSPTAEFIITGSMDNITRIYNAQTGQMVRQIAEHNHYVQGVAWDPLNEFVATQSSDRSVHIYNLRNKDGEFTLKQHNKVTKMDMPNRRISASSPAPPDLSSSRPPTVPEGSTLPPGSPAPEPSIPGTPTSLALPMNPPSTITQSRRSSFGSSPSVRRSASPAPSMPLPAVRPMENSPIPYSGLSFNKTSIYANETFNSFFRRLAFTPEGSLLFTPAGQYKTSNPSGLDGVKSVDDVINTVYIYTRAGFNKPPIAHLPGHKKPSVAVKCSPIIYSLRSGIKKSVSFTIDTSSSDEAIPALPASIMPSSSDVLPTTERPSSAMEPPPTSNPTMPSPKDIARPTSSPREPEKDETGPAFNLPYRIVYAVATQDAVLIFDTQQQSPLCVVSNLHFATFTDLTWSPDGLTLLMSSSDGFCSTLSFSPNELGTTYTGTVPTAHNHSRNTSLSIGINNSAAPSPVPTPTGTTPSLSKLPSGSGTSFANTSFASPAPGAVAQSPTKSRSNSVSSIATQSSFAPGLQSQGAGSTPVPGSANPTTANANGGSSAFSANSPTPTIGTVPGLTALNSAPLPLSTPPMTPMSTVSVSSGGGGGSVLGKRGERESGVSESEAESQQGKSVKEKNEGQGKKRRRIAPTPVSEG